jgi:hypothetical protein
VITAAHRIRWRRRRHLYQSSEPYHSTFSSLIRPRTSPHFLSRFSRAPLWSPSSTGAPPPSKNAAALPSFPPSSLMCCYSESPPLSSCPAPLHFTIGAVLANLTAFHPPAACRQPRHRAGHVCGDHAWACTAAPAGSGHVVHFWPWVVPSSQGLRPNSAHVLFRIFFSFSNFSSSLKIVEICINF